MTNGMKIGLSTTVLAIASWFILELIGLVISMNLRPRFTLVFCLMGIIGILILLVSYVSKKLKMQSKKYMLAVWVMVEMIAIIICIFFSFFLLLNLPTENETTEGLVISYIDRDELITDYNFVYYR